MTCLNIAALAVGPWPNGVLFRYPTVFGATVDITARTNGTHLATCGGCDDQSPHYLDAKEWAQEHSEKCRALPKPTDPSHH